MRKILIWIGVAVLIVAIIASIMAILYAKVPAVTEWFDKLFNKETVDTTVETVQRFLLKGRC